HLAAAGFAVDAVDLSPVAIAWATDRAREAGVEIAVHCVAFVAGENPAAAENAARQVSATGRQALTEMQRLLGVLRDEGTESMRAPQPGIEQLDLLAAQVRSAGLATSLTLTATPFRVPPTAQLVV